MLAALSGLSHSAAYEVLRESDKKALRKSDEKDQRKSGKSKLVQRLIPRSPTPSPRRAQPLPAVLEPVLWTDRLWKFLYRSDDPSIQIPIEDLAVEHDFSATQACALIDRATILRDMSVNSGSFTFPMTTIAAHEARRLYCPLYPHLSINRNLVKKLAPAMHHVLSHHQKLANNALQTWVERSHRKGSKIRFNDISQAAGAGRYRDLLVKLGVSYQWVSDGAGKGTIRLDQWRKKAKILDSEPIYIKPSASRSAPDTVKEIVIILNFPEIEQFAALSRINGDEAIRFLLMMAWIYVSKQPLLNVQQQENGKSVLGSAGGENLVTG
jgi:hypothetical protein